MLPLYSTQHDLGKGILLRSIAIRLKVIYPARGRTQMRFSYFWLYWFSHRVVRWVAVNGSDSPFLESFNYREHRFLLFWCDRGGRRHRFWEKKTSWFYPIYRRCEDKIRNLLRTVSSLKMLTTWSNKESCLRPTKTHDVLIKRCFRTARYRIILQKYLKLEESYLKQLCNTLVLRVINEELSRNTLIIFIFTFQFWIIDLLFIFPRGKVMLDRANIDDDSGNLA